MLPSAALASTIEAHIKATIDALVKKMKSYLCQATCSACNRCEERQLAVTRAIHIAIQSTSTNHIDHINLVVYQVHASMLYLLESQ